MRTCPYCNGEVIGRKSRIYCRSYCLKMAWKKAHPEVEKEIYRRDGDRIRAKSRAWGKANAKRKQSRNRAWYAANREAARAIYRKWREANREQMRQCRNAWKLANPERVRVIGQRRRARQLSATIGDIRVIVLWEKVWKRRPLVRCYWCQTEGKPRGFHSDHIIALAIGGAHEITNLCIACAKCNARKSDRTLSEWNNHIAEPVLL